MHLHTIRYENLLNPRWPQFYCENLTFLWKILFICIFFYYFVIVGNNSNTDKYSKISKLINHYFGGIATWLCNNHLLNNIIGSMNTFPQSESDSKSESDLSLPSANVLILLSLTVIFINIILIIIIYKGSTFCITIHIINRFSIISTIICAMVPKIDR